MLWPVFPVVPPKDWLEIWFGRSAIVIKRLCRIVQLRLMYGMRGAWYVDESISDKFEDKR